MVAFRCDRCKEYYIPYEGLNERDVTGGDSNCAAFSKRFDSLILSGIKLSERKQYDLCPNCMEKLIKFMENDI